MAVTAGALVDGRYRVGQRVATGDLSEVWSAQHTGTGARVALKVLLPEAAQDPELVLRFKREAHLLARVYSEHVPRVLDVLDGTGGPGEAAGPALVMDFLDGPSLYDVLAKRGRLTVEEVALLGADLATALDDLHRVGVIHRDVKPANIVLQPRPDGGWRACLVGFVFGRVEHDEDDTDAITGITGVAMAMGTLEYMAPEQVLEARDAMPASDVYALGAVLFRCATGVHVFQEKTPGLIAHAKITREPPPVELGRDDPAAIALAAVIARAIQKHPNERYASGHPMSIELQRLREIVQLAATSPEAAEVAWVSAGPFGLAADATGDLDNAPTPSATDDEIRAIVRRSFPVRAYDAKTVSRPVPVGLQEVGLAAGFAAGRGDDLDATTQTGLSGMPEMAAVSAERAPASAERPSSAARRSRSDAWSAVFVGVGVIAGFAMGRWTAGPEGTGEPAIGEGLGAEAETSTDQTPATTVMLDAGDESDIVGVDPAGRDRAHGDDDDVEDDDGGDDGGDDDDDGDGGEGSGWDGGLPPLVSPKPPPFFVSPAPPGLGPAPAPTPLPPPPTGPLPIVPPMPSPLPVAPPSPLPLQPQTPSAGDPYP